MSFSRALRCPLGLLLVEFALAGLAGCVCPEANGTRSMLEIGRITCDWVSFEVQARELPAFGDHFSGAYEVVLFYERVPNLAPRMDSVCVSLERRSGARDSFCIREISTKRSIASALDAGACIYLFGRGTDDPARVVVKSEGGRDYRLRLR